MTALVIVESPGKLKKISAILGSGYVVKASVGHVRDLPKKELGVDLATFRPEYQATERGADVLKGLKAEVAKAEAVYIASDPDREGESIAWHLVDALKLKGAKRITFNEISEKAVKAAIAAPRGLDMALVHAADARRVLDRLIGWHVSPVLSDAAGEQLSAGRVQSPAVRLVVDRERAIKNFKPVNHFGVDLHFDGGEGGLKWKAAWDTKPHLSPGAECLLDAGLAVRVAEVRQVAVSSYEETETRSPPKAPFTTSALQQAASAALKMKPAATIKAAQSLYEAGKISYLRTDSPNLSDDGYADAVAAARGAAWPVAAARRTWQAKEGAQEGHVAISPTHCSEVEAGENEAERALYRLIRLHTLASVLDDAVYAVRTANLAGVEGQGAPVRFVARGKTLISKGWKAVYEAAEEPESDPIEDGSDNPVPKLAGRSSLTAASGAVIAKVTKAPGRFKQATLVKELERQGIGRPSTYAAILEHITTRGYISEDSKDFLHAEPAGEKVVDGLAGKCKFVDLNYTRLLEAALDDIAAGKAEFLPVVAAAHSILSAELAAVRSAGAPVVPCPVCAKPMKRIQRKDKTGFFWSCSGYPDCKHSQPDVDGKPGERQARVETPPADRVYFEVKFDDREKAKKAGLRWDGEAKKWFAPSQAAALAVKGFKRCSK